MPPAPPLPAVEISHSRLLYTVPLFIKYTTSHSGESPLPFPISLQASSDEALCLTCRKDGSTRLEKDRETVFRLAGFETALPRVAFFPWWEMYMIPFC